MLSPELRWLVTPLRGTVLESCSGAARCGQPAALPMPLSHQATELLEAILEGYPKSKKQFFVSTEAGLCPMAPRQWLSLRCQARAAALLSRSVLVQEEVGIETDEDHNVTLPAAV